MDIIVNGVLLGLGYCLITSGIALILGVAKIFDLVYSGYYLITAYLLFLLFYSKLSLPLWLIFLIGVGVAIILALLNHKFLILPIRKKPTAVMVLTIAICMIIQELLIIVGGPEAIHVPAVLKGTSSLFGVLVTKQKLLVGGVTIGLIGLLWLFFSRTRLGLAIRATAEQPEAMQLAGGNIRRMCLWAAILSAILAAIGALLIGPIYPPHPYAWLDLLIIAFAVMVLGGLGNLWGCVPAALILGVSEVAFAVYVPYGGIIKRSVGLIIIFMVLVFRPIGLFGTKGWEEEE
ncbi:MAG: branched-chain amino acid ABC transporter permease [Thermodesulfobacteriota bacterium]